MRKILFGVFAMACIVSCSKKNIEPELAPENNTVDLKEISPEDLTKVLASKANDTLYVTNFFATWCGPCMKEIPHFKEQKNALANQPVKFQFVSLDAKNDWAVAVTSFAVKNGLEKDVLLLDGEKLNGDFFSKNFKSWDGSAIPFTLFKKGDKVEEFQGMMSEEELKNQLQSMLQ